MSRRDAFLQEMGLGPIWRLRGASPTAAADAPVAAPEPEPVAIAMAPIVDAPAITAASAAPVAAPRSAPARPAPSAWDDAPAPAALPTGTPVAAEEIAAMDWEQLERAVSTCTRCDLCRSRKRTVFGVGDRSARWLLVGEGPGRNEDQQGLPFVGPAGKLLDNMLLAMDLKRGENTFIANVVKCRPTDANGRDRQPDPVEVAACLPYLQRQVALLQPAAMVALGKTAAVSLLGLDPSTAVGKLRGTVYRYRDVPLVVTYHPAYLLRTPADKGKSWADLCLAMQAHADSAA